MNRTRTTFLGVASVALTLVLASCTSDTDGGAVTSPEPTGQGQAVMEQLAAQLRPTVDAIAKLPKTTQNTVTGDESGPCSDDPTQDWPAQTVYSRRVFIDGDDSRPAAEIMTAELEKQGWTIRRGGPGNGPEESSIVAVKDGASVTINSGTDTVKGVGAGIAILAATACVAADGTIDHTNPS